MNIQSLTGKWQFQQVGDTEWLPATVPGGVHTDLLALGRIPDPFVGDNEKRVAWVAESDWVYRTQFDVTGDVFEQPQIWLVCDGLDTLAAATLNGQLLGETDNMFRQYRWDVKELLTAGENSLRITFASPVKYITEKQAKRPMVGVSHAMAGGPHMRKAPCHFGWDWGPKLPPIGVWKEIRLEAGHTARLDDVYVRQVHGEDGVTVSAEITPERWSDDDLIVQMEITAPDGEVFSADATLTDNATLAITIPNPQLWYPNGYPSTSLRAGSSTSLTASDDQPLYAIRITQYAQSSVLDERTYQIGLRTIELRQEPDEWGESFEFIVNGIPVFAKGSNWIPVDSFPTRISDDSLEKLIRDAAATHHNMLRVWGGGFYEEERFYDLCDKYGILVWQDFVFACSIYPHDEVDFTENVRVEVEQNVRRIRHRASLALWCGNNEMEWGWESWGWADQPEPTDDSEDAIGKHQDALPDWQRLQQAYKTFFHETLPSWVDLLDPDTPYWPSSPSSDTPFDDVNGQVQGDAHYWDVWHGRKPFTAYRDQYPRFMSEFGFQALPPLATIRTFADEADWNMTSYIMEQHQKNDSGNSLMVGQMLDTFRLPKDFSSLVYLSMVLQAEGIRYGVEHWRRARARVAGTLYWQLNDCWPVASWSSLDYFGRWKALHYAARRFYAPLLLSIEDAPPQHGVFVTSDLTDDWQGDLRWSLETLDGEVVDSGQQAVEATALANTHIDTFDFAARASDDDSRRNLVFIAELCQADSLVMRQTAYFAPTKHLRLTSPIITATCYVKDDLLHINLTSHTLARLVELSFDGLDVVFSDNYFDLPAGRTTTITCPLPAEMDAAQAESALQVRSVYDSFG